MSVSQVLAEVQRIGHFQHPDFSLLRKQKLGLFEKYGFSDTEKKQIYWVEFLIDFQDNRKKNIFHAVYVLDSILKEISKRYNIELKLLHYLLPHEVTVEGIRDGSIKKIAWARIKGCIFVKQLHNTMVFSGQDFLEFEKAVGKYHNKIDILTGITASLGTATGAVKICTNIESLSKIKEGDILVASMTRPEYVQAMKKAAAIVTDEGGITCHAAIVSRELGIPCVIGTRNATKVLKDGWIVQVKANHGEVLVLEKK